MLNKLFLKKSLPLIAFVLAVFLSATPAFAFNPMTSLINFFKGGTTPPPVVQTIPVVPKQIPAKPTPTKRVSSPVVKIAAPVVSDATIFSILKRLINQPDIQNKLRGPQGLQGSLTAAYTFPTTDGLADQVLRTNGAGVLRWGYAGGGGGGGGGVSASSLSNYIPYTGATTNINLGANNLTVDTNSLFVDSTNHRVGLGTVSPTAVLHLKAGTTTANTAPIKFTSGSLMTTAEAGAIEFDGTNLYYTDSTPTRRTLVTSTAASGTYVPYTGATTNVDLGVHNLTVDTNSLFVSATNHRVGIGTITPTAYFQIKAGTAAAGTAPLKLTSGTLNTTAEAGAIEFDGTNLYYTDSTPTRRKIVPYVGATGNVNLGAYDLTLQGMTVGLGTGMIATNMAFGLDALSANIGGTQNQAMGYQALKNNTSGVSNTAIGLQTLYFNSSGGWNTAVGLQSLFANTTGTNNIALGYDSLITNETGSQNTALGTASLYFSNGDYNTALGWQSGSFITGGITHNTISNTSVYLGAATKANADGDTNEIVIGYNAIGAGSNSAILGNTSVTKTLLNGKVGIGNVAPGTLLTVGTAVTNTGNITVYGTGTTCTIGDGVGATMCTSDLRLKDNVTDLGSELNNIMALRPITFTWKDKTKDQITNIGLIAQEVQPIYPNIVHKVYDDYLGIDYAALVVPTIKAVQELNLNLEGVAGTVTPLPGSSSESFVTAFFAKMKTTISAWFADAGNSIGDIFAGSFHAKDKLCINNTCVTEAELQTLLQNAGAGSGSGSGGGGTASPLPAPVPLPVQPAPISKKLDRTVTEQNAVTPPVADPAF